MTVEEICAFLERRLPKALAADWDNDGLACLPERHREVRRVLVALDASEAAVERAISGGFDLLLTHHPLLFRGIRELTPAAAVPRKLLALANGRVAALSFHTRLDAAKGGVNDVLADLFGLTDVRPFAPEGEVPCGRIGKLPQPVSAGEFANTVCRLLGVPALTLAGNAKAPVATVAVLGGEGGDYADAARAEGADLFLSGRIGYHRMLDAAEEGLVLIEAGHYATEFPVCAVLAGLVAEADPAIRIEIMNAPAVVTVVR